MKRRYILALSALTLCGGLSAQDIYKVEALSGSDLNGTARFVGMGGAMNALGADLSTIGTNPAAIGLYRRNDVALTGSATIQPNGQSMAEIDKARGSFDQAGFVYACKLGGSGLRFINFAFNYQKRKNFKQYIGLEGIGTQNGLSQSWQMRDLAYYNGKPLDLSPEANGASYTTPLTVVGYDAQLIAPYKDNAGNLAGYDPSYARSYDYHRVQWGGIQQYDFNVSFNHKDQIYGGITFGLYNVDMHTRLAYAEDLYFPNDPSAGGGTYNMSMGESLSGTGFDIKAGLIFRPIEDSPFRMGVAFSTPIFFDLTQNASLQMVSPYQYTDDKGNTYDQTEAHVNIGDFDYRIRTPWRFNLSLATTLSNWLALDVEYEVSRLQGGQVRYYDDGDSDYSLSTTKDEALQTEIKNKLQAVHTLRIGAEARLADGLYGRLGYNYVTQPVKDEAYLNLFTSSPSYNYSVNTDYVNPGAINRVTAGLGWRGKRFYADLAYQAQLQQATVYAFDGGSDPATGDFTYLKGQKVDLNRHNVMLTVGVKF